MKIKNFLMKNMMRWMIIGDFFKIAVWVLGTVAVASADFRNAIVLETVWYILFSISLFFYNRSVDTEVLGIGFMFAYILMFVANLIYVKSKTQYFNYARAGRELGYFV